MSIQWAELILAKSDGLYFKHKKEIRRSQVKRQKCCWLEQSKNSSPECSPQWIQGSHRTRLGLPKVFSLLVSSNLLNFSLCLLKLQVWAFESMASTITKILAVNNIWSVACQSKCILHPARLVFPMCFRVASIRPAIHPRICIA